MRAMHELEADECSGCGHPLSETTDPESEGSYAADAIRCHACTAKLIAAERHSDPATNQHTKALRFLLRRIRPRRPGA